LAKRAHLVRRRTRAPSGARCPHEYERAVLPYRMETQPFDLIVIGSGSAMTVGHAYLERRPGARVAVIDKDEPGGICLTRGCIPSKLLLYPAGVVREVERASTFGIETSIQAIRFEDVMRRMRSLIDEDISQIRYGLEHTPNLTYFHAAAEFVAPYTLQVGTTTITAPMILLGLGSEATVPSVPGLRETGYLTSDTVLQLTTRPGAIAIVGGGYIAAEYGHFFSAMGCEVTIVGRNPRFLPGEEPEISETVRRALGRYVRIQTGQEVVRVERVEGRKRLTLLERSTSRTSSLTVDEILIAAGRGPTTGILRPERGGIDLDAQGWVRVNEFLETSQPKVWAFGDANGRYLFKHKANWEAEVVYENVLLGHRRSVDYHAVPHAVFTYPEVAAVGLGERAAREQFGDDRLRIGFYWYRDTAKGQAMGETEGFVKVLIDRSTSAVLGAHVVGPDAANLIQEVVTIMYTPTRAFEPIRDGMHIHPALSEVVERAVRSFLTPTEYAEAWSRERNAARERNGPKTS
ncbi:MAG: dihydrolipoyl dehydrogenase, partial [Thermoplasmata archaeon]